MQCHPQLHAQLPLRVCVISRRLARTGCQTREKDNRDHLEQSPHAACPSFFGIAVTFAAASGVIANHSFPSSSVTSSR